MASTTAGKDSNPVLFSFENFYEWLYRGTPHVDMYCRAAASQMRAGVLESIHFLSICSISSQVVRVFPVNIAWTTGEYTLRTCEWKEEDADEREVLELASVVELERSNRDKGDVGQLLALSIDEMCEC